MPLCATSLSPAPSAHGLSTTKPCAKNDQLQLIKELVVPDSDISVSVFKMHMVISQNETGTSSRISVITGRCVVLTLSMIVKLDLIRGNILVWINAAGKMSGESPSNIS